MLATGVRDCISDYCIGKMFKIPSGSGLFVSDADARPSFLEHEWRELANFTNEKRRNSRHSLIREIRVEDRHLLCATTKNICTVGRVGRVRFSPGSRSTNYKNIPNHLVVSTRPSQSALRATRPPSVTTNSLSPKRIEFH